MAVQESSTIGKPVLASVTFCTPSPPRPQEQKEADRNCEPCNQLRQVPPRHNLLHLKAIVGTCSYRPGGPAWGRGWSWTPAQVEKSQMHSFLSETPTLNPSTPILGSCVCDVSLFIENGPKGVGPGPGSPSLQGAPAAGTTQDARGVGTATEHAPGTRVLSRPPEVSCMV